MGSESNEIENREKFVRWQGQLITQSSHINNLLLGIGIAIVGFIFSMLKENIVLNCIERIYIRWGLFLVLLSIMFGIIGAISRLYDYRTTVKKIRLKLKSNPIQTDLDELTRLYKVFGNITWACFYSQTISLGLGVMVIGYSLLLLYNTNLF
ncbi:MAG: hypothetical protein KBB37_05570 [Bacteroidia bacterium]|nr:hypothetical protein [Bacteroidia bacterium]MBP9179896.1 hypothetical protein [Bacteroidia bacterium]MBP9724171.1 hypothetical protein [Bacteroidia bacterium]